MWRRLRACGLSLHRLVLTATLLTATFLASVGAVFPHALNSPSVAIAASADPTLEELLEKQRDALGGARKLQKLQGLRVSGTRQHAGFTRRFVWSSDPQVGFLEQLTGGGLDQSSGIGTERGFAQLPGGVVLEEPAAELSGLQLFRLVMGLTWLEPERFQLRAGRPVFRQEEGLWRVTFDGPSAFSAALYFDPKTHLLTKATTTERGARLTLETANYRKVKGVNFPHFFQLILQQGPVRDVTSYQVDEVLTEVPTPSSLFQPPKAPVPLAFQMGVSRVELPAKVSPTTGLVVVEVGLPGESKPTYFLLDSGADVSVLEREVLTRYNLPVLEHQLVGDEGNSEILPMVPLGPFTLGASASNASSGEQVLLERLVMPTMDLKGLSEQIGQKVEGILGAELFARCVVTIDARAGKVYLQPFERFLPSPESTPIPIDASRRITVELQQAGGPAKDRLFLLDTGSTEAISISSDLAWRLRLEPPESRRLPLTIGKLGGESKGYHGRLERIQFGPFAFANPIATFEKRPAPPSPTSLEGGLIGMSILSRFRVSFDLAHKSVWLEPLEGLEQPFAYNRSGLFVGRQGAVVVTGVREGIETSITKGDRLVGVRSMADSRPEAWMRRPEDVLRALQAAPKTELMLEVSRGATTMEVPITLEDWL